MRFERHTEQIEQKAMKAIGLLRKVKETEVLNTKCMLQLYKALITPQLEYAAAVSLYGRLLTVPVWTEYRERVWHCV